MPTIHFLNVGEGDCIVVQHGSGRVSMIDISSGNMDPPTRPAGLRDAFDFAGTRGFGMAGRGLANAIARAGREPSVAGVAQRGLRQANLGIAQSGFAQGGLASLGIVARAAGGNLGMGDRPTRPQEYLRRLGISEIWRFVLTHPDMDHLDGFHALLNEFTVHNFWHWGAEKEKPSFSGFSRYSESDWDRYVHVRDGRDDVIPRLVLAGDRFSYANLPGDASDGIHILAPTPQLVAAANASADPNDGSYVILYRAGPYRIIFAGDSHDRTWEHILANHRADVANCDVLIAPHHGRDSDRSWEFLDVLKPALTLFGVARSEHLAYDAWNRRGLPKLTNNQAGNIVIEIGQNGLDVFVENDACAEQYAPYDTHRNALGYRRHGGIRPRQ